MKFSVSYRSYMGCPVLEQVSEQTPQHVASSVLTAWTNQNPS